MRVADFIIDCLSKRGISDIFLVPGGGAMHLNDAIASHGDIKAIPCHHEQASAIAAEAYGRTSPAGFGVAMVTTGPGATNAVTPVAGAWIDSLPLLILSGQVKRADAIAGRKIRQGGVQEVDIIPVVQPITKYAKTLNDPKDVRRTLDEALWHMLSGRPGPVWLDIPLDVQASQVDPDTLVGWTPPSEKNPIDASWVAQFHELLKGAKRPLVLAGHGVNISGGAKTLRAFVEAHQIPCVFTWNAADILPFDHPLYIGRPGVVAARAANFAVQNCDLLIAIGCRLDNVVTAYNPKGFARAAKKIVIDIDTNELDRHDMAVDLRVAADAKTSLTQLVSNINATKPNQYWLNRCSDWKTRYPAWENPTRDTKGVMTHNEFCDALSEALPTHANVITGSSGLAVEVFYMAYRNREGQRMFLTSGLGAMGYGVSAAMGACIGSNRKQTFCIESDGSLMMNIQELATLKAQNLPITVVVMNNGGYASIRNTQRNYFNGRFLGSDLQSGLLIPDLANLARAFGLAAETASTREELLSCLAKADAGPRLIDVRLSPDEILAPKVSAMPQADGSMISMPLEDMSPLLPLEQLRAEMLIDLDQRSLSVRN